MRALPSIIIGLMFAWSSMASLSARGTSTDGATFIYEDNVGTLYFSDGSSTTYTGGDIQGGRQ